ncbi:hypothetical protein RSC3_01745 [Bacillus paralicheniformis]|nr:hypothetical protein RSC3_01745 [Bacillus paralicheniformis]
MFRNVKELIQLTKEKNVSISEIMIAQEIEVSGRTREEIFEQMEANLTVMEDAVQKGVEGVVSHSGLTGETPLSFKPTSNRAKGCQGMSSLTLSAKRLRQMKSTLRWERFAQRRRPVRPALSRGRFLR